jgi:hypothetical protein
MLLRQSLHWKAYGWHLLGRIDHRSRASPVVTSFRLSVLRQFRLLLSAVSLMGVSGCFAFEVGGSPLDSFPFGRAYATRFARSTYDYDGSITGSLI